MAKSKDQAAQPSASVKNGATTSGPAVPIKNAVLVRTIAVAADDK